MDAEDAPSSLDFGTLEAVCSSPPPLSSSTATDAVSPGSGLPMDGKGVSSSPGFMTLEEAFSSPPPRASQAPLSPSTPAASIPPESGRPMDGDISSSPGCRRLEAACSSPPLQASRAPLSSSAPDPPPPSTSTPLAVAEPSTLALHEGNQERDLKISFSLMTRDSLNFVDATFRSTQTIRDVKEFFETDVFSAENMVAYHDGAELSSMTILENINGIEWNSILLSSKEAIMLPIDDLPCVVTNEDISLYEFDESPSTEEGFKHLANLFNDATTHGSTLGQSDIAEIGTTIGAIPVGIGENALPSAAENASETAYPTAEAPFSETEFPHAGTTLPIAEAGISTANSPSAEIPNAETTFPDAETSAHLVTPSCTHVLIGRLLIPVATSDFRGRLLSENKLHGFKNVNELINAINRGPPRWITKKQALALLHNAEMFSICDVQEDAKKDGLSCVVDSKKCQLSSTLGGYSAVPNVQSSEHLIGKMKEKGVEMDWFEVRGKIWSRRRLVLRGGDGVFHLLQWKQHQNIETTETDAAARASAAGDHTTQELRPGASDSAPGASTSAQRRTRGLGEEMKALIQDFQTTVCSQFKDFQTTVSTQLSEFNSQIQRMDTRVQALEQQRTAVPTPTIGSTPDVRESSSSSSANPVPRSDD